MLSLFVFATASAAPLIPYETYTLDNGLEVILAPQPDAPLVHVEVTFHVGSRDEQEGQHGWTHMVEHLLFSGTPNSGVAVYEEIFQGLGVQNNASTDTDRLQVYETLPPEHLPVVLWAEADRMEHLSEIIDAELLKREASVIKQEYHHSVVTKPYGQVWPKIMASLFPQDHPYHHDVIGDIKQVQSASAANMKRFLGRWFGPENATLVIAGAFSIEDARALVGATFGRVTRQAGAEASWDVRPSSLDDNVEIRLDEAHGEDARVYMVWPSPPIYQPGDAELDLISQLLGGRADSRLHRALVEEQGSATEISAYQYSSHLASTFVIEATVASGRTGDEVAEATQEVIWALFNDAPPTDAEINAARALLERDFYLRLSTVAARGHMLSRYTDAAGTPDYVDEGLARYLESSPQQVLELGWVTLSQPHLTLHAVPAETQ